MDLFGEYEMGNPELTIVIVTFNTRDLLLQCLQSVRMDADAVGRPYQVIVVDNASTDGTAAAIRSAFPSVHLIENAANVGPARAFNQGLAACPDATCVLLMNSDIQVPGGTLGPMMDYLDTHQNVAGVTVQLLNPDRSPQKFRISFGTRLWPARLDRVFAVTFFGTTFHMGRRATYSVDQVGPFDENYYFFNEDLDWSIRAHRRGLVFHYLPNLQVIHYVGQGRAQNRNRILSELYPANLYLYAKFYGRSAARLLYLVQSAELLGRLAYLRVRGRDHSFEADAYRAALVKHRRYVSSLQ
jgi:GT2 family glycosyltransferase